MFDVPFQWQVLAFQFFFFIKARSQDFPGFGWRTLRLGDAMFILLFGRKTHQSTCIRPWLRPWNMMKHVQCTAHCWHVCLMFVSLVTRRLFLRFLIKKKRKVENSDCHGILASGSSDSHLVPLRLKLSTLFSILIAWKKLIWTFSTDFLELSERKQKNWNFF